MRVLFAALLLSAHLPSAAIGQEAPTWPVRLPASGGEVIIPGPAGQHAHDVVGYAPARRAGDTLYLSGVIVGRREDEGTDAAAFEAQTRRALGYMSRLLTASGASFDDVALINSFHVWEGPDFTGTRDQQIEIISRVWREFSQGPRPAWTAVGTTGLLGQGGVVEIQLTVHAPGGAD